MAEAAIHRDALPQRQLEVLRQLGPTATREGFYLGGGTGLALQLGHRRSVDLDWFTDGELPQPEALAARLHRAVPGFELRQTARGTLLGAIQNVAASFLSYPYPALQPRVAWRELGVDMASVHDIACMKLSAVAQRGARRDFVDVFAIGSTGMPLGEMLDAYRRKYAARDVAHVLAGLAYFDDAEREPMPAMLWRKDWGEIRRAIETWVKAVAG